MGSEFGMYASATIALALLAVSVEPSTARDRGVRPAGADATSGVSSNGSGVNQRSIAAGQTSLAPSRYSRASFESILHRREPAQSDGQAPASSAVHTGPVRYLPAHLTSSHAEPASLHGTVYEDDGFCSHCCGGGLMWGRRCRAGAHALKGLLKPDMPPHTPYRALPAEYYYFRPYNILHIPAHQEEVITYGEDPRMPYANRVFDDIYGDIPERHLLREEIAAPHQPPMPEPPMPMSPAPMPVPPMPVPPMPTSPMPMSALQEFPLPASPSTPLPMSPVPMSSAPAVILAPPMPIPSAATTPAEPRDDADIRSSARRPALRATGAAFNLSDEAAPSAQRANPLR
jgi:hypothetical protein